MLRARGVMFTTCFLFLLSSVAMAQTPVINADQVKSWMEGKQKVLLVDTRTPEEYQQSHIPGAVNIMPDNIKSASAKLPKDKKAPIIFYCRGMDWGLSRMAAVAAQEIGYTNIMVFQGGMPEWINKGYPVISGAQPGKFK